MVTTHESGRHRRHDVGPSLADLPVAEPQHAIAESPKDRVAAMILLETLPGGMELGTIDLDDDNWRER